jgi:hypothetical protein
MRFLLALMFLFSAVPAAAQTILTSAGPQSVSVSLYRDPNRSADQALDLQSLTGFALISETREVDLPPGIVTIRFEGVASGIQPETAIVTGTDLSEKNRDRLLLSQRGLLDAFTGQQVIVKRTNQQTGAVTEETGTIRSGGERLILQTNSGYEALYCNYKPETLIFPGVPKGLSAKPTLSVLTRDQPGGKQTITLTYLAGRFDWQANYVGELAADSKSMNLVAWLTMASGDTTSFVDANAFAIAGKLERQANDTINEEEGQFAPNNIEVFFSCWPFGTTTSDLRSEFEASMPTPVSLQVTAPAMLRMQASNEAAGFDIIVTATKRVAEQEDLGDLKLYRIPFPVTVAAQSQKQVAFLDKKSVKGEIIYRSIIDGNNSDNIQMLYRIQNKKEDGLGEALPSGKIALFQSAAGRRMLVGESQLNDKAVGEEVDLPFGNASNVSVEIEEKGTSKKSERLAMTVSNANPFPVSFEGEFTDYTESKHFQFSEPIIRKKGKNIWKTIVPPNSQKSLRYRRNDLSDNNK